MQHLQQRIISIAEPFASACTIAGAFGLATGSITLLAGYAALFAGSLSTFAIAIHRRDKGLLARQGILASIHGWAIFSVGA